MCTKALPTSLFYYLRKRGNQLPKTSFADEALVSQQPIVKSLAFAETKSLSLPVSSSSVRIIILCLFDALSSSAGSSTTGWVYGSTLVTVSD